MNTWEALKLIFTKEKKVNLSEAPARDPKKIAVKKIGSAIKEGRAEFEESVVDLEEIQRAYFTDSYIRKAVDKYAELMFKEGWEIPGKDDATTEYVWTRLKLMAEATGIPIEEMMKEIGHDLVLFGNAFVVKARQKGSSPASGVKAQGYTGKQPIAGYFVLPPATIQIARDDDGKITGYQQDTGDGNTTPIKAEDMIHFHYKRPRGRAFGVPMIFNVLDDVKILRQVEENVARLIYRNLFPLYQYQVGIDKPGYEATDEEVEELREEIRDMPMDGGIIVPERHNISVIGAEGSALDASEYLKYFRQRVFTGLGVSDSVMGIGDSANKSTSDNQSADLIDGVKEFQSNFAITFTEKMINEILFEGGYDPILNPEHEVHFEFFEIALDAKIKKENHAVQLFTQNAITHDEMRKRIGTDPVVDETRLYFNMITKSIAEHAGQVAADSQTPANNAGDNKNQPANQHGKKDNPGKPKREMKESVNELEDLEENSSNVLTPSTVMVNLYSESDISTLIDSAKETWNYLREDLIEMIKLEKTDDFIRKFAMEPFRQRLEIGFGTYIQSLLRDGVDHANSETNKNIVVDYAVLKMAERDITSFVLKSIDRVLNDALKIVETAKAEEFADKRASLITGVFESNEYRLHFIARAELHRAFNYGKALAAEAAGIKTVYSRTNGEKSNQRCIEKNGQSIEVDLVRTEMLKKIPSYHPGCQCTIELVKNQEEV